MQTKYLEDFLAWWKPREKELRKLDAGDLGPIAFTAGTEANQIGFQLKRIADAIEQANNPVPVKISDHIYDDVQKDGAIGVFCVVCGQNYNSHLYGKRMGK